MASSTSQGSLPSYLEHEISAHQSPQESINEKPGSNSETKDFVIDFQEPAKSQFNTDSEKSNIPATQPVKQASWFSRTPENVSSWIQEWGPFMLVSSYFVGSVFMYLILPESVLQVFYFFYMAANFYIAANTVIEACLSLTPIEQARKAVTKVAEHNWVFPTSDKDVPIIDIVIVAYLPNEQDIIIDRTLYAVQQLVYPTDRLRINIVYNTPRQMPELQTQLHGLTAKYSNLRVMQVPNSSSKADNVNYFLSLKIETDIIAIFDCDHYPHPYGPRWAAERFVQNKAVDVVQGRCIVFNADHSILTSMIAVEFDKIYAVSHPGRAEMWQFGLFCGSNGYWKADLLRGIAMDGSMLTEDIDSALRALGKNINVIHELNAVSYELAPTTYRAFWKQRLRWAQGWTQASIKHAKLAWTNPEEGIQGNRNFSVRAGIVSLLFVRELSYYLVTQYTCLVINFIIVGWPKNGSGLADLVFFQYPVSEWFFILCIITLIMTLVITNHVRSEFVTYRMIAIFTITFPFYLVLNATMGIYGNARELMGYNSWNPTAR
ncbi:putative glycosyltransferase [Lachnellula suecica]|uniref:Putative glycosyltransferase n=1 Tax=Lachnellula suecica TaxID=602035 RepID=A0A8T9C2C2_9HELO|nr:putative glycosyltransferase [Lachnellula suecica]